MQCPFHVSSVTRISQRRRWHSPQLQYAKSTFDIGDANLIQVHRALWLWAEGHITYEGYIEAKNTDGRVSRSIQKPVGPSGKHTRETHFSKSRWEGEADKHILGVWTLDDERLTKIREDTKAAQSVLLLKVRGRRKASSQTGKGKKHARGAYTARVVSDSDF
jgi:hypothetical protein